MGEELKWTKGSAVRAVDGRNLHAFVSSKGSWSISVSAHDLDEGKRKLRDEVEAAAKCPGDQTNIIPEVRLP